MDCTPDGQGDCVVDLGADDQVLGEVESGSGGGGGGGSHAVFVKPEERRMKFQAFVEALLAFNDCEGDPEPGAGIGVPYLSHQVVLRESNGRHCYLLRSAKA